MGKQKTILLRGGVPFGGTVVATLLAFAAPAWATAGRRGGAAAPAVRPKAAPTVAHHLPKPYHGPLYVLFHGRLLPYLAAAQVSQLEANFGGAAPALLALPGGPKPHLVVPGSRAVLVGRLAAAPLAAPQAVKEMIWAANEIVGLPYLWGGGHGSWWSPGGYDCSGTVSYALHGGSRLRSPEDSTELEGYGKGGHGVWVTVFANAEHAYLDIAGLRLDTSPVEDPSGLPGPQWRPLRSTNAGYVVRHPSGL